MGRTASGRARKISRLAVTRAGMRIARRDGFDAVTIRAVAARLDVTPMALYHHVGSRDGLRDATVDQILLDARTLLPADDAGAAPERLRAFARAARDLMARYPGSAARLLEGWTRSVQGCRVMEWLLVTATECTGSPSRAVAMAHGVFVHTLTQAVADASSPARHRASPWPMVEAHPERWPHLVAARERFARIDGDRDFEAGLDVLLETRRPRRRVTSG